VRAAEYPGRRSQLTALLTILPYLNFTVGAAKPAQLTTAWRSVTRRVTIPLINHSNQAITFLLRSRATAPHYRCEFVAPSLHKDAGGQPCVTLAAGQRLALTAQIPLRAFAWLRLEKQPDRVQILIAPLAQPEAIQTTQVQIQTRTLFGPWQLATLFLLAGAGFSSALILAVALLALALRPTPPVANPPPASSPPIAIVVNLAQPATAANSLPAATTVSAAPNVVSLAAAQPNPDPALPIIDAAQVSAPGAAAPPATFAAAFSPQPADGSAEAPKTYQQMFQEIALRYDLNWRVLAAQAYVESGFDALALGNSGDLGLMQILPSTWREWAPAVDAVDPFDSYSNTLVAASYLDYLRAELGKKGYPQIEWMLVAYNWGIDKVLDHLAAGQGWEDLPSERRQYALDILRIAETIPVQ
jgi:soluble lytic murein transglycosylase-like protein